MSQRDLEGWTIAFDLDGTLVDSAPDLIGTLNRLLVAEGLPPRPLEAARHLVGHGAMALLKNGFAEAGAEWNDEGGKVLVWAMRRWVVAVEKRTCPVAALGMALSERGLMPTLAPFHRVMGLLATHARQDLPFSPFCSPHVSEGEAVLLAVISNCRGPRAHTLETTLFLLVGEEGRASMHDAILQLGEALDRAGMLPAVPAPLASRASPD